jgi:hypothetical protein
MQGGADLSNLEAKFKKKKKKKKKLFGGENLKKKIWGVKNKNKKINYRYNLFIYFSFRFFLLFF